MLYVLSLLVALALVICIALTIRPVRRAVRAIVEQITGYVDASAFSRRSGSSASALVAAKASMLARRAQVELKSLASRYHHRLVKRALAFRDAQRRHRDAAEDLERTRAVFRTSDARASGEGAFLQRMPATVYFTGQALLGIFDLFFTYFAFELWQLPTLALAPLAMLLGAVGVIIGHFLGQAIVLQQREVAWASAFAALSYCVVIGTARFGYLMAQAPTHMAEPAIGAFGIPVIVIFASALLATQLRVRSALQAARDAEHAAQRRADAAFQEGLVALDDLSAAMHQHKERALELIAAYCMGFRRGWRNDAFDFPPEPVIEVPPLDWPPAGIVGEPGLYADLDAVPGGRLAPPASYPK